MAALAPEEPHRITWDVRLGTPLPKQFCAIVKVVGMLRRRVNSEAECQLEAAHADASQLDAMKEAIMVIYTRSFVDFLFKRCEKATAVLPWLVELPGFGHMFDERDTAIKALATFLLRHVPATANEVCVCFLPQRAQFLVDYKNDSLVAKPEERVIDVKTPTSSDASPHLKRRFTEATRDAEELAPFVSASKDVSHAPKPGKWSWLSW